MAGPKNLNRAAILTHDWVDFHAVFDLHLNSSVAMGLMSGASSISFGSTVSGFSSTDNEIAFREGTPLAYGADLDGATVYAVSSSASDTDTYRVQGVNAAGDRAETNVTLTGTTPVALSGTWNHIQSMVNTTADSTNVGEVYTSIDAAGVPNLVADKIQTVIGIGDNYGINPEIWVPNSEIWAIDAFDFSQNVAQSCTIKILANRQGTWILNFKFYAGANSDNFEQIFHTPLVLQEGDRFRVLIEAGGGTSASATFGMNGTKFSAADINSAAAYLFEGVGDS